MRRLARILLFGGTIAVVVGLSKVHAAWIADPPYDYTGSFRFAWSLVYVGMLGVAAYGAGLPDLTRTSRRAAIAGLGAASAAALMISLVQMATGDALLPRFVVFGAAGMLQPWYVICGAISCGGTGRAEERDRIILVATPDVGDHLIDELARAPERPARVVSVLTAEEARGDGVRLRPLVERVVNEGATVLVLDRAAQIDDRVVAQSASLHEAGVRVRTLSLFYEEWLAKLPLSELERVALMFDIGELHRARYGRMKRLGDILLGVVGAVALLLLLPVVILGNLVGNRGPLLYTQGRVGRWGREFTIYKFRTMRSETGEPFNEWTTEDDPRIAPFGRLLRRTHLDELPQVLNILTGDLSVIGPRPEQPHYVRELLDKIPFYGLRHLVRPGLTGWAQVKYGYAGTESDALEKLQYDFYYLRYQGLMLDVRIVGRTIRAVVGRGGR